MMGFLSSSSPTQSQNNSAADKQRISDLEEQLKEMSYTAAAAIDRVSELEEQLNKAIRSAAGMTRSASTSSQESFDDDLFDDREKLRKLQRAVNAIHNARRELRDPAYYQYI